MKLLLHIGYPKTGTTTLQSKVFSNTENINYLSYKKRIPEDFYHLSTFQIYGSLESLRKNFEKDIDPEKLNLYSNEEIMGHLLKMKLKPYPFVHSTDPLAVATILRKLFENYNVGILFTIRYQIDFLKSHYAQRYCSYSRTRQFKNFNRFVNYLLDNKGSFILPELNYYNMIKLYQDIFGKDKVKVLVYEDMKYKPEKFLNDLSKILETDVTHLTENLNDKKNVRKTKKGYRARKKTIGKYLVNIKLKYFDNKTWNLPEPIKKALRAKIPFTSRTLKLEYTEEQERQLFNHFKESNEKLDEEFNLNLKEYGYY